MEGKREKSLLLGVEFPWRANVRLTIALVPMRFDETNRVAPCVAFPRCCDTDMGNRFFGAQLVRIHPDSI